MTDFVKKASLTELENKIHGISGLATKTALTTQPAYDVSGTSPEGLLKVLLSVTSREPSDDS